MKESNRVIKNTLYLYTNMIVSMVVQLASVRILIKALGVEDYGIYSLVAGVVAMFAFINVAMSASTQRFLSYAIGEGKPEKLKEVFYQSVVLHLIIGAIVLLALEIGGNYYVHHLLKAPEERIAAAAILLHCITASTFVNIITVPYEADINANEDMGMIALINILDAMMKLGIALTVHYVTCDKLILYGILTMLCIIITLMIKRIYCLRHYPESHFRWHKVHDMNQARSIMSFTAWNLIGSGCGIARYQGTGMILNYFFVLAVNTAYGVAQQVNALLLFFANSIVRAIRPQVIKSEGMGDRPRMLRLSISTCKITSLMVALLAIPLGISIEFILNFWLDEIPHPSTIMFCRYFLIIVFTNQLTVGLGIAFESVGKIKLLQIIVGTLHLAPLLFGYLCFTFGMTVDCIMLCIIIEEIIALVLRTLLAQHIMGLKAGNFLSYNIIPTIVTTTSVTAFTWWICSTTHNNGFLNAVLATFISVPLLACISYFILLNDTERNIINNFALLLAKKIKR